MEAVEINAGEFYLRQLRSDDRIDDCPALVEAFADAETRRWLTGYRIDDLETARRYVKFRTKQWESGQRCSWAVCDAVEGTLVGEVGLKDLELVHGCAEAMCWTHPAHRGRGIAALALGAALRFGFGGVGLHRVGYRHSVRNTASQRIAEKCGFTREGTLRDAELIDGERHDLLLWSRLATDPEPDSLR